jgi:hypothetical protein
MPFEMIFLSVVAVLFAARVIRQALRRVMIALALCLAAGCAHAPAPCVPESPAATPAPAQIQRLTCGGRSCGITEAGGTTVVWINE